MSLKPQAMEWIDLVTTTEAVGPVLEALAAVGAVQIESAAIDDEFSGWNAGMRGADGARDLRARLRSMGSLLPVATVAGTGGSEAGGVVEEDLEAAIDAWSDAVDVPRRRIDAIDRQLEEADSLCRVAALLGPEVDLGLWQERGDNVRGILAHGDKEMAQRFLASIATLADAGVLGRIMAERDGDVSLGLLAPPDRMADVVSALSRADLQVLTIPEWAGGRAAEATRRAETYRSQLLAERARLVAEVEGQAKRYRIAEVRWMVERECWLQDVARDVQFGDRFARIGGWAPARRHRDVVEILERRRLPYLARFADGVGYGQPPSLLSNPTWSRRFELFVRGFGMPASDEIDSTLVLALVTPLMFGYMFGDVGQGLVLLAVGLFAGPRIAWARLLVPAGCSAVVFGFLFGSVFSVETVLPPLWLHPMEHPLTVLAIPVVLGAGLILVSVALGALQTFWRGDGANWVEKEAPTLAGFVAAPVALVSVPAAVVLAGFGLGAAVVLRSNRDGVGRALLRLPVVVVETLEKTLQMLINSLSFSRLGAFALGHAGLSGALVSLADLPDSAWAAFLILVLGNLFIIALEGLVVSIQTTRLVMFEFFRRFFEGRGRLFRPLTLVGHPGPAGVSRGPGIS